MRYLSVCLFLVAGLTVVNGQYFCNAGTHDPTLSCAKGQYVYCCDSPSNTDSDPSRKQGFPTWRKCGNQGLACTVKNRAGGPLIGSATCC
ncbi:hypothetical protein QIS74_12793 [Colletotrichum tabaci]|uniref:Secreted protein n=1 Tax=Colletotrichum tabaci TaxID=1209068 RepID=A0AAV9SXK0_9PEZI